jgi:hypothetical protein
MNLSFAHVIGPGRTFMDGPTIELTPIRRTTKMPARISVREARRLGLLPDDPPPVIEAPSLKAAAAWTVIIGYAARKAMHLALAASAVLATDLIRAATSIPLDH